MVALLAITAKLKATPLVPVTALVLVITGAGVGGAGVILSCRLWGVVPKEFEANRVTVLVPASCGTPVRSPKEEKL